MRAVVSVRETLEERALSWLKSKDDRSKEAAYCMRIIGTKARNAAKREPARAKRIAERGARNKLLKAAGEKPTAKTRKAALRDADMWYSRFIRLRDSRPAGEKNRMAACVTCGKNDLIQFLECGHWRRRENWSVRFHHKNTHPQCNFCNNRRGGEELKHEAYILQRYGAHVVHTLKTMADAKYQRRPSNVELELLAKAYEKRVTELGGWPE
jgi:hypothetical protein